MARFIEGELYLSPDEASAMLGVSYKTLQRWVEAGHAAYWKRINGKRKRAQRKISVTAKFTPTGYRIYKAADIKQLLAEFTEESKNG